MEKYEDLTFKPAITWGDLVEGCRAIDLFYKEPIQNYFSIGALMFFQDGRIKAAGITIAENRSYEQMKTIINALWGE